MSYSIGIEDLVSNALIELWSKKGLRTVSFSKINEYGSMVVKQLNDEQKQAVLLLSRDRTNEFIHTSQKYFSIKTENDDVTISVNEEISLCEIRKVFRSNLALDVLVAFADEKTTRVLAVE